MSTENGAFCVLEEPSRRRKENFPDGSYFLWTMDRSIYRAWEGFYKEA
jgi:hypothetical protein